MSPTHEDMNAKHDVWNSVYSVMMAHGFVCTSDQPHLNLDFIDQPKDKAHWQHKFNLINQS